MKKIKLFQNISLSSYFAFWVSVILLVTVVFISAYFQYITEQLLQAEQNERFTRQKSMAAIVFKEARLGIDNNDYKKLQSVTNNMIDNNLIKYVYLEKNSKTLWINKIKNDTDSKTIKTISGYINDIKITVGIESETALTYIINNIYHNNTQIALLLIFTGFILAVLISRFIITPINKLIMGVNEFGKRNFDYKLEASKYTEINQLVDAFNKMALNLNYLYSSLEQKVEERTQEIEKKNIALNDAYAKLKETHTMMVHSEKMRSLGELVAGITHEINNPVNFIYGNLVHLKEYSENLIKIIDQFEEVKNKLPEEDQKELNNLMEEIDYEFIKEDLPSLIKSCRDGADRTKTIVTDLKSFSRLEEMVIRDVDLHKEIDAALNIIHNKLKYTATLHKEYGDIPTLPTYGGQLNQVFINILDNAAYAIGSKGDIYIRTKKVDNNIIIEFEDNGSGISKENLKKICEPFFTTKPVGDGSGLGMSISYKVIKSHNGEIKIESEEGKGTKVSLILPLDGVTRNERQSVG